MAYRLRKTVALVGMMGSGKTAVGGALARILGVEFQDSDDEIRIAANRSIAEIFARDGEPFFRQRETEVLGRLLEGSPCILSTGGGAFLAAENQRLIDENGVAVWLKADLELLWSRVRHKNTRPLLQTADPHATLKALCEEREESYAKAAIHVEAQQSFSIDDMARQVAEALLTRADVLEKI